MPEDALNSIPVRSDVRSRKEGLSTASLRRYLEEQLPPDTLLEIELMLLALAVGINDATTYSDYRVFVSNQTGNTALLAVGSFHLAGGTLDLKDIGFSLGIFILGATVFGQIAYRVGRTKRAWLLCTNVIQACLVLTAAALRQWVPTSIQDPARYAVICLLSFASGGQVAMARTVNVPEVTTAMITSAYVDFVVDPLLLARHNRPRNRRGVFVLSLLAGTFIGAAAYRKGSPSLALLLAGLVKSAVCVLLFFNRAQKSERAVSEAHAALPQSSRR